jgi:hypothetical protein
MSIMPDWVTCVLIVLYFSAIPALLQLVVCLFAKSGRIKSIPIILSSLFWLIIFITAFLFYTPLLKDLATYYHMEGSFIKVSDQVLNAILMPFAIGAQALVWLIVSHIQRILRKGK